MAIVLAADGVGAALATADTDNGDGGAGQPYQDVHILEDDAQEAEESGNGRRAGLPYVW